MKGAQFGCNMNVRQHGVFKFRIFARRAQSSQNRSSSRILQLSDTMEDPTEPDMMACFQNGPSHLLWSNDIRPVAECSSTIAIAASYYVSPSLDFPAWLWTTNLLITRLSQTRYLHRRTPKNKRPPSKRVRHVCGTKTDSSSWLTGEYKLGQGG